MEPALLVEALAWDTGGTQPADWQAGSARGEGACLHFTPSFLLPLLGCGPLGLTPSLLLYLVLDPDPGL